MTSRSNIVVRAERDVAYDSPDHIMPWGTRADSSKNQRFNNKLYHLFPKRERIIRILDIGCAGGGFVKNCLDDGCFAVGLEGSDYSKKMRRAEWATIPDYLFTCDITAPFEIFENGTTMQFDVVTAWEVMEHIKTEDLPTLISNVKRHLKQSGLWIMSVSPNEEVINRVTLHQTVQDKGWWIEMFQKHNITHLPKFDRYFNTQYVRGPKYNAPGSFHLILNMDTTKAPPVPEQGLGVSAWMYDRWLGSRYQKLLRRLVVGE